MVISFLQEYGRASRKEIDDLLMDKLSDILNKQQKRNQITNLLYEMSHKDQTIIAVCNFKSSSSSSGPRKAAKWQLQSVLKNVSN